MVFFSRAKLNEVLILETIGIPTTVSRKWCIIPFPCCQTVRRFRVGECKFRFESNEVRTRDGKEISASVSLKFAVDTKKNKNIMKAYKEFVSGKLVDSCTDYNVADLKCAIVMTVSECIATQTLKMRLDEIIQFNWLFTDTIFMFAKSILEKNYVILKSISIDEITEYTKLGKHVEYEEENLYEIEIKTDLNEEEIGAIKSRESSLSDSVIGEEYHQLIDEQNNKEKKESISQSFEFNKHFYKDDDVNNMSSFRSDEESFLLKLTQETNYRENNVDPGEIQSLIIRAR